MMVSLADAPRHNETGQPRNRCGAEPVQGPSDCTRDGGAATERGLWAMHTEQGGSIGRAYSKAAAVTGGAPISPSADAVLISTDSKEAGLWLWQGEAPPPPSLSGPKSRDQQILRRIMPAAGWAGWIALPTGLALTLIAISMMPHPDRPVSADRPAVALSSAPSPTVAPSSAPSSTVAGPIVATRPVELTEAQLDQVRVPSAPAAKITARGPEQRMTKSPAQHKSSRAVRKARASHVRKGPPVPIPEVLTPPPMTWHGGGY